MPHPIILGNGIYHLNVRVPSDIADAVKGTRISLPTGDCSVAGKAGDKVIVSLRTKDARLAKDRVAKASAALAQHWTLVRAGPSPLSHKQAVAVAGIYYWQEVEAHKGDPALTPEAFQAERDELRRERDGLRLSQEVMHLPELPDEEADRVVDTLTTRLRADDPSWDDETVDEGEAALRTGAGTPGDFLALVSEDDLRVAALMHKPHGPAALAFRRRANLDKPGTTITYDAALETFFPPFTPPAPCPPTRWIRAASRLWQRSTRSPTHKRATRCVRRRA